MIDQDTQLYISASGSPGKFGATVFNSLFKKNKINAVYLPRKFICSKSLVSAIRLLNIQGCAVSNPMKASIIDDVDSLDQIAQKIGSINTIKVEDGKLIGFNTDWIGAVAALAPKLQGLDCRTASVRILGSGGVVPALIYALRQLNIENITVSCRNMAAAEALKLKWQIEIADFQSAEIPKADVLINAIPESFQENNAQFLRYIRAASLIFDLGVSPTETQFIKSALCEKKEVVSGYEMAKYQLAEQYKIYFNQSVSNQILSEIVQTEYLSEGF